MTGYSVLYFRGRNFKNYTGYRLILYGLSLDVPRT